MNESVTDTLNSPLRNSKDENYRFVFLPKQNATIEQQISQITKNTSTKRLHDLLGKTSVEVKSSTTSISHPHSQFIEAEIGCRRPTESVGSHIIIIHITTLSSFSVGTIMQATTRLVGSSIFKRQLSPTVRLSKRCRLLSFSLNYTVLIHKSTPF